MTASDHPRVAFPMEGDGNLNIGWGFLSIIDGVPWLAATLEDAESQIPATMIRLDPALLESKRDNEQDEPYFHYRGPLRSPR